jgi:hypothetical protein
MGSSSKGDDSRLEGGTGTPSDPAPIQVGYSIFFFTTDPYCFFKKFGDLNVISDCIRR